MAREYFGAPASAWATIMETIQMDMESSAFDKELRAEIRAAYDKLAQVHPDPVKQIKKLTATVARLRDLLGDNLIAWEDEEESVKQEHHDLIRRTRRELR